MRLLSSIFSRAGLSYKMRINFRQPGKTQDHPAGPDEISYQLRWSKTHIPPFGGNQFGKEGTHKMNETTGSTNLAAMTRKPLPQTGASWAMGTMDLSPGRASKATIHRTKRADKASRMASLCMAKQAKHSCLTCLNSQCVTSV